eukprot:2458108-Rhodomonas_salina.3
MHHFVLLRRGFLPPERRQLFLLWSDRYTPTVQTTSNTLFNLPSRLQNLEWEAVKVESLQRRDLL